MKTTTNHGLKKPDGTDTVNIEDLNYNADTLDALLVPATTTTNGLMSKDDKTKLNGVATGANNYTHPATHPASMISGLHAVATSGSYNDLLNKPSTFPPSSHTHTKSQITDFPTSLPASDVYSWAKASTKPTYTASEVGALPTTGGTVSGAVNFANNTWNKLGDDVSIGDCNTAGCLGIKGNNGNTGIYFAPYTGSVGQRMYTNGSNSLTLTGNFYAEYEVSANKLVLRDYGTPFECSKYIDFHDVGSSTDYDGRLYVDGGALCYNSASNSSYNMNIPWEINNLKSSVVSGKQEVANAINDKTGSSFNNTSPFADMAWWIRTQINNASLDYNTIATYFCIDTTDTSYSTRVKITTDGGTYTAPADGYIAVSSYNNGMTALSGTLSKLTSKNSNTNLYYTTQGSVIQETGATYGSVFSFYTLANIQALLQSRGITIR